MDDVTALYRELDPLRPLRGDENGLYVDWQHQLDPEGTDAKSRLIQTYRSNASPDRPVTRFLTGHRGCGKTTELNRVRNALSCGEHERKVFVSTLFADEWLDLEDVQPEDLVLQIVRQLTADLNVAGVTFAAQKLRGFFATMWKRARSPRLESVSVGADPLKFNFSLEHFPTARDEFRDLLRGELKTVFGLVNDELLPEARKQLLRDGYDDVLLIVDDLDRIQKKVLVAGGMTNHDSLFIDGSSTLRAINCSLLLTVPIELAYSPAQARLRDIYGAAIETVPLLPIMRRDRSPIKAGEDALIEIVGRRARAAFGTAESQPAACAARVFADEHLLRRVVQYSGGHLRSLLVTMSQLLDWIQVLPLDANIVDRYAKETARDFERGLFPAHRTVLRQVDDDGMSSDDPIFLELLRNLYVFAYRGDKGNWFGLNPLLREIDL
jgi:hypothetical protein